MDVFPKTVQSDVTKLMPLINKLDGSVSLTRDSVLKFRDEYISEKQKIDDGDPFVINISADVHTELLSASGIFSFTFYRHETIVLHDTTSATPYLSRGVDVRLPSEFIYIYGILTYILMCKDESWKDWKVLIFMDQETIDLNPKLVDLFQKYGGLIAPFHIKDAYKDFMNIEFLNKDAYEGLLRIARYYPMFYYDCPVFVRDADTMLSALIYNNMHFRVKKTADYIYNSLEDITIENPLFIPNMQFVKDFANYETTVNNIFSRNPKQIYCGTIVNYALVLAKTNISNVINNANKNNYNNEPYGIRYLAGFVNNYYMLPETIWNKLGKFIKQYTFLYERFFANKLLFDNLYDGIDEHYLSLVINNYATKHKNIGNFAVIMKPSEFMEYEDWNSLPKKINKSNVDKFILPFADKCKHILNDDNTVKESIANETIYSFNKNHDVDLLLLLCPESLITVLPPSIGGGKTKKCSKKNTHRKSKLKKSLKS